MRVRLTVTGCAKVASALFRVGGQGKPVRIRRGPATVTGDATRTSAAALEPLDRRRRPGKVRDGRPGSQETCPDRKAHNALVERGGSMSRLLTRLAVAALAIAALPVASASAATVSVRVEGATRTILPTTIVNTAPGTFNVGGGGPCSATTVGGALQLATAGQWQGRVDPNQGQT